MNELTLPTIALAVGILALFMALLRIRRRRVLAQLVTMLDELGDGPLYGPGRGANGWRRVK